MRVLLVEDSDRLQQLLAESLRSSGYSVDLVGTAAQFRTNATAIKYDLIVLDLGLPDEDGLIAIKTLRSHGLTTPILIITARGSIEERVTGLDSGADDYLTKPFNHGELLARARALLRRPLQVLSPSLREGNTEIDEAKSEVRCSGRTVDLRLSERRLLALLMRRAGRVVAKSAIEEALSEFDRELTANAIEALVSRLRKALNNNDSGIAIDTVRGVGYRLREELKQ